MTVSGEVRNPLILRRSGIEVSDSSPPRRGTSADDSFSEDRDIELRVKFLTRTRSLGRGVQMMMRTAQIIVLAREYFWSREKSVLNVISDSTSDSLIACKGWQVRVRVGPLAGLGSGNLQTVGLRDTWHHVRRSELLAVLESDSVGG